MKILLPSQKIFLEKAMTGDILLTSSDSWYAKIIKWKTKSEYNHVGFIYRLYDRRLGIKIPFVIEAIDTGITMRPLINYFNGENDVKLTLARHKGIGEKDNDKITLLVETALKFIGEDYDYMQLVVLLFNGGYDSDRKLICSQFLDKIFKSAGIVLNYEKGVVTPASIGRDQNLDLIMKT